MMASTAWWVAGGSPGDSRTRRTLPTVVAIATWPRITRNIRGSDSRPDTSASMLSGIGHIGNTRPLMLEDPAQLVERGDGVGQHLVESRQDEIADRVAGKCAAAAEAVLEDRRPQSAVRAVRCQSGQRHSQVARRHHIQLATKPARRTAVIGDRDHRGDVRSESAGSRQRGVEPMPTTEGDDARAHSRPRSRCNTRTVRSWPPSKRSASASAIATLRCLPPVQPMATVI